MIVGSLSGERVAHYLEARLNPYTNFNMSIGIRLGSLPGGGIVLSPNRYFSHINQDGFALYTLGIQSTNTALTATIWAPPGSLTDWHLWFDNTQSHYQSENNFSAPARAIAAGTALITGPDDETRTYGSVSRLYYYSLGGAITPTWSGSTSAQVNQSPGMDFDWASTNWWARMGNTAC